MKINIKSGGKNYKVDFKVLPQLKNKGLFAMAKSSKDLDELQAAIANRGAGDDLIGAIILKSIEKKTKLPMEIDRAYEGSGYGFVLDFYSIAKSLN